MSGEPVRDGSAARIGPRDDVRSILILLALGLIFRVIIAYLLPGSGFANDISAFQFWASNLASQGPGGFYARDFFHDYTPGYLYVLWAVGLVGQLTGGVGDLIKIPPILADLALAYLAWSMTLELGASRRAARLAALIIVVNPITWFDSVVWGQVDSFGVVFMLLGLRELWRDRPERSAVLTVLGALVKPQLGILIPIVAAVTIRRALWPAGGYGDEEPGSASGSATAWERRTRGPVRIVTTGAVGLITALALAWPFGLSFYGLVEQIFKTAGGYPYLSVNAWNPWALVTFDGSGIASNSAWVCDMLTPACGRAFSFGPIPAVVVGTIITLGLFAIVTVLVARRPDRRSMLVGLVVLALAFFVLPTRVHERYLFPLVALGAMLAAVSPRWTVAYLASGLATMANMYFVLTTLYPNNPSIHDWLGAGRELGSFPVVAVAAITQTLVLIFALSELRAAAAWRLANEIERPDEIGPPDSEPASEAIPGPELPALAAAMADHGLDVGTDPLNGRLADDDDGSSPAAAPLSAIAAPLRSPGTTRSDHYPVWDERPSSGELGFFGWLSHRLNERPIRRDRSRDLVGEGGGRLDRLDLWMIAVLAVSLLTVRVWRLAEPYQMHFDEVYHPRTAIEFLQFWRYGISHDIYEWTHPHLAKYAMAGGIVAWGNDRTSATSDLGIPVGQAVVEPRWDESSSVARDAGDRLWLTSGNEVRAYDLRSRALVATLSIPGASALAIDAVRHRMLVGTGDGRILAIDTTVLDAARLAGAPPASPPATPFAQLSGPATHLIVTPDGGTVVAVIPRLGGAETPLPKDGLAWAAVVLDAESGSETGRTPVADVAAIANAGHGSVALATGAGVSFLDTATSTLKTTVTLAGSARGMAIVTNLDKDRLYVSFEAPEGPRVAIVTAPGTTSGSDASSGPSLESTIVLPGDGAGWVGYDLATQTVHVAGTNPETGGPTIYVIEPHSNGVYADAELPFKPVAVALDANQRYPSSDREQLLAFDATGAAATVDVGHHAFAWRLPGVLAGVAMALLLYLLARILFRRREVAVLVAFLTVVDGMLFAQSRIGMNDSYVGLGIVAAYLLFAAIWRSGSSRERWLAFWLVMPLVGVSLGLALAAKWVAAYAIGALGILVLARSALGRLILLGGLIGVTTVLGYMGLSVPEGQSGGNYLFMAIMVALTLAATAANVLHPIAWTDEEERLLVRGPAGLGLVLFGLALLVGRASHQFVVGPIAFTAQEAAFALVLLSVVLYVIVALVGRWGFGPRALALDPDDPTHRLAAPAAAPEGWLRPGAAFGLPMAWTVFCLVVIPLALYVASYIPWAFVADHQIVTGWPAGHGGQTLADLTGQMYRYHNNLSSPHAASSPWWAWPFDFKPVWFYQSGFAGGTAGAIYDSGNLVAWWMAIPAIGFAAWQAFVRRNTALALVVIGLACQWLAWARIDRAAFQYHYYTSLPFLFLALGYFLAELWHGASRRTWLLARLAGGAAVLAPTVLWLFHRPLCGFVRVDAVNPGSQACPTLIPDFLLSGRAAAIAVVVGVGVLLVVRALLSLADESDGEGAAFVTRLRNAALAAVGISLGFVVASAFFDDTPIVTLSNIPVEPIALIVTIALLPLAAFVATARDARRFVAGLLVAMGGWFILWYPNISGLPLPQALSNAYQGFLPTYVYPFQFPVSTVDRNGPGPNLFSLQSALLLVALTGVVLMVGYAVWVWRVALVDDGRPADPGGGPPADLPAMREEPPADDPGEGD